MKSATVGIAIGWLCLCGVCCLLEASEDGFINLFADGTLSGWVEEQHSFFKKEHPNGRTWSVRDGVVACDGSLGNCGFLRYEKKLCDFVLRLEYRMSKGCNSGIGIRAAVPYTTLSPNTLPLNVGYEFQILDDAGKPISEQSSGSFYGVLAPRLNGSKPAGRWNSLEIVCRGPTIRITLNGQVVQDVDQTKIDAIKGRSRCGYISLQNHGHGIEFRGIRLKELD